jgi:thiamine biosynthesis protein ThiS
MSIQIQLNGDPCPLPLPLTVHALLGVFSLDPRTVAVEVNKSVVRRAAYDDIVVNDGDEVEIVAFVGGG